MKKLLGAVEVCLVMLCFGGALTLLCGLRGIRLEKKLCISVKLKQILQMNYLSVLSL